ncbi:Histidine kinase-, DNA gyrase B-, and HSP90-like ATPase [Paenibacillus uliginis N3/975]|uniref:histidine kinase n=1 Tax=Paenibacillus uliginis N3/975 TaxID=1313296 RepID=A0A1X7GQS6_9BACL|nr:sensor histidine kinase [Paenibacillus uliginis]SMF73193.1 Histidine kinase-, DNA gyrase B-, and HSP90-like ATPase [Paenibacillus uliginis N3/975]
MQTRRKWFPNTLKYRLFIAYITLLMLPLCIAIFYLFQHFESIRQNDMIDRMSERMQQVYISLTDMMAFAYKANTMLSQDESLIQIMHAPDKYDPLERKKIIESKMFGINNSFFFHQTELYFRFIDRNGNVYTSYAPNDQLTNERKELQDWQNKLQIGIYPYRWVADDLNDVRGSQGSKLLSLYIMLDDELRGNYGLARISINIQEWFRNTLKDNSVNQDLTIFTGQGETVLQNKEAAFSLDSMKRIISSQAQNGHYKDERALSLVNYSYVEELDWYVVSQMPLSELQREVQRLRLMIYMFLIILVTAFILVTFFLASRMTQPLYVLKRSMEEASDKKLNVKISINKGATDEIRSLSESFNRMIDDVVALIAMLKLEERQKQVVRFQMLLYQMNPHFLLNTLNTVKWIARKEKQDAIAGICTSLGLILEASLNSDIELVPLKEEIKLLRSYESIQAFRFREHFTIIYETEESVQYALVPKFSLQPLAENSIVHGFNMSEGRGTIWVRARAEGSELILEVEDNGIGMEEAARKPGRRSGHGIGLSNLRERLELLFKREGVIELISDAEGTLVRIRLPLLIAAPYSQKGDDRHVDDFIGGR